MNDATIHSSLISDLLEKTAIPPMKRSRLSEASDKPSRPRVSREAPSRPTSVAGPSKPKPSTAPRPALSFLSTLKDEETDFPRGGGSSLTPFEQRQVQAEGRREADAEAEAEVS